MVNKILSYIAIAAVLGICYGLLSHHILFFGRIPKVLPKAELTMTETFVNVKLDDLTTPKVFLRQNPDSRRDGAGDLLVEMGILTYEELMRIEDELDAEDYEAE